MMASMSAGCIWVATKRRAESSARNWSGTGMAVMSKYSAISRRSAYCELPGVSGLIWIVVEPGAGALAAAPGGGGGAADALATAALSSTFWNSAKATFCGTPSSVIEKSLAVRPVTGLPPESVTATVSTTSQEWVEKVNCGRAEGACGVGGLADWDCWAGAESRKLAASNGQLRRGERRKRKH